MHTQQTIYPNNKKELYSSLTKQLEALVEGEAFYLPNLANAAALLFNALPNINWAGFYLLRKSRCESDSDSREQSRSDCNTNSHSGSRDELVLGPFQGKVACVRIPVGKGVCGTAVAENRTQLVPDVHKFPGHIACDSASNSEIVVPIRSEGEVVGVLDIDSPIFNRFDEDDKTGLEAFVKVLESACDW